MIRNVIICMLLPLFVGCATLDTGAPINKETLAQIKDGVTTKSEIIEIFGQPKMKYQHGATGQEMWKYYARHQDILNRIVNTGSNKTKSLTINFSDKGTVVSHDYLEMSY